MSLNVFYNCPEIKDNFERTRENIENITCPRRVIKVFKSIVLTCMRGYFSAWFYTLLSDSLLYFGVFTVTQTLNWPEDWSKNHTIFLGISQQISSTLIGTRMQYNVWDPIQSWNSFYIFLSYHKIFYYFKFFQRYWVIIYISYKI